MTSRGLALTLGALIALAYASVLFGGQTFADPGWLGEVAPARFAAGDAVAHGELPAWWHEAGFGAPLLAEGTHGALYPPSWLGAAGGGEGRGLAMLDLVALLHLWLLAIGTSLLAERLGADAPGRLLAGAAAALAAVTGGALVGGALFSLAWSPLAADRAFALAEAGTRRERVRAALAIAACLAMAGLGGAPAVADGTIATVIVIGAVVGFGREGAPGAARGAAWCLAAAAGSLALAAVQIAPALIHAASGHAVGPAEVTPGIALIDLVAPGASGASGALLGGGAAVIALASLARTRWLAWPMVLVVGAAAGVVPAALAWVWFAALAGAGITALTKEPPARATWIAAATAVGAMAAALAASAALRNSIARAVDEAGLDGAAIVEHAILRGALAVAFAAATVALALVAAQRRQAALGAAAALLALVEIVMASRGALPRRPRNERPPLVAALDDVAPARVFRNAPSRVRTEAARNDDSPGSRGDRAGTFDAARRRALVDAALAHAADASTAPLGIAAVPGRDPGRLAVEDRLPAATANLAARYLDRYAIPYAIVPRSVVTAAGLRVIAISGNDALVAVEPRRTPAFWVSRWRHVDDVAAIEALAPPPGRVAEQLGTVLLAGAAGDAGGDDSAAPRPCKLARPASDEVRLACDVTAPGYAVVLDAWAPGWSATVDGRAAAIERADLVARAVRVGPGARAIVFRYTPPGFWLGAAISALAALNAILLLALTRTGRASPAASGEQRDR